jgi:glycogen synthase
MKTNIFLLDRIVNDKRKLISKPLRIFCAAGCGDVIGTYNHWVEGQDDPSQVALTYSAQFYDVCRALNAEAYIISSCQTRKTLEAGQFKLEHRPFPLLRASGILYHLNSIWYGLGLITSAVRFRANVAIVADGMTHWFIYSLLSWLGVKVILSLHCVLWCQHLPQTTKEKWILKISRRLLAKDCAGMLVVSDDIAKQVSELTSGKHQPIIRFLPVYRRQQFIDISDPEENYAPFKVLFVGRIESAKGVFDLLEIAKGFAASGLKNIQFNLCGSGSALESLRFDAEQAGVTSTFVCRGYCDKQRMQQMYSQAHVVIVPTRTDFVEGFNKVVVEGVLAGRPVVTSSVCPALSSVRDAIIEVTPDDIPGYSDALLRLYRDRQFYAQKRRACLGLQAQFYDLSQGWGAKFQSIVETLEGQPEINIELNKNLNLERTI